MLVLRLSHRGVAAAAALACLAGTGCAAPAGTASVAASATGSSVRVAPSTPPPGSRPDRVSPLRDRSGLHPGLTAVPPAELGSARAQIRRVAVAPRVDAPGYDREAGFGPAWTDAVDVTWGRDGCKTREQILHRDLKAIDFRAGTRDCVVLGGILQEPYTGRTIEFSKSRPQEVQIDHVIPLSFAWDHGAARWSASKRLRLAGDPLNLLAVDGAANQSKSDSGPSAWLPQNRPVHCAYAVRFALVARKYGVTASAADRRTMLRACA
ncbi:hypothetical protein DSM112329_02674 [Paraconexibacter sp. AEG42_29]|uniref:GmrSD restriction endonucleases C-terminal domain-containing protein n=1 Tax=Paraconexibacter sp. AEG42_29 TaxID=2997339 RepID=A0AAU7AVZ7_9ACTN